jgi:hypothetical protein
MNIEEIRPALESAPRRDGMPIARKSRNETISMDVLTDSGRHKRRFTMEGPARGCLASFISWKLGGGLVSTILIFIIAYWLLGKAHC